MTASAAQPGEATLASLVREGVTDAELAALLWLLAEGGVPLVVGGLAEGPHRARLAAAVLGVDPRRPWMLLDAEAAPPDPERLGAILQGGVGLGLSLAVPDLAAVMARLSVPPGGLSEDAVRRLGVVVILGRDDVPATPRAAARPATTGAVGPIRILAAHYLRPTERDGQGHLQRRPPAVLAVRDPGSGDLEHFAWGITPELADRVGRSQADLEERQASRGAFLERLAQDGPVDRAGHEAAVLRHLEGEPPLVPAPPREAARPSPFHGGLSDPHVH